MKGTSVSHQVTIGEGREGARPSPTATRDASGAARHDEDVLRLSRGASSERGGRAQGPPLQLPGMPRGPRGMTKTCSVSHEVARRRGAGGRKALPYSKGGREGEDVFPGILR